VRVKGRYNCRMNIAMSCAGEGFGHVSRMISFAQGLRGNYGLVLFCPASVRHHVERQLPDARIITIPFFHMAKKEDRILYGRTVRENAAKTIRFRREVRAIRRHLAAARIDAVISDYEPYLPAAAKALDLPVLQVNHPGIVLRYSSLSPDALVARVTTRLMMGRSDRRLTVSFYDGDIGPILRDELLNTPVTQGSHYVVYAKPTYRKRVVTELKRLGIRDYLLFPDAELNYAEALASCRGLITSAGHQSLSEAITLGKPVFAIPQSGQYEQRLNARMLVASGWGMKGRFSNLHLTLPAFLDSIERFPLKLPEQKDADIRFCFSHDRDKAIGEINRFVVDYSGKDAVQRLIVTTQYVLNNAFHSLGLAG
jgi:uncharacterized protein (TIGR00661 family)